jgi:hypothetical protein
MSISVAKMALVVLGLAASGVYVANMEHVPVFVGIAIGMSLLFASLPLTRAPAEGSSALPKVAVAVAFVIAALGLAIAWATAANRGVDRAARVLSDLGWAQAVVGAWLAYSSTVAMPKTKLSLVPFDDNERARWRAGELAFGADLARRIVVAAQPSWAALVVETAWPEPRPEVVTELLKNATTASRTDVATLRASLENKGSASEISEARWELARVACDVIDGARGVDRNGVGGPAVARFIVASAATVRDDDDATRIFAALILPAIARRA